MYVRIRNGGSGASQKTQRADHTEERKLEFQEAFKMFNTDGTARIQANKLDVALCAIEFKPTKDELRRMMTDVAKQSDGFLDFPNVMDTIVKKISDADTEEEIHQSFFLFGNNRDRNIDITDLKYLADLIGEIMSHEELLEMINQADQNRDGFISDDDFKQIVSTCIALLKWDFLTWIRYLFA
jgi:Ca2+-binding EF-hand superfamily protein